MIINGSLNLKNTSIESLDEIEKVLCSKVLFDGELQSITSTALNLEKCIYLKDLGNLKEVIGSLYLSDCVSLKTLSNLEKVDEFLNLINCESLNSLGNLKEIGLNLNIWNNKNLTSLENVEVIGKKLIIKNCPNLKDLGNLKSVKAIEITNSGITKEYVKTTNFYYQTFWYN